MRKILYAVLFLLHFLSRSNAQENLILNPSFEDMNWCWSMGVANNYMPVCSYYPYYINKSSNIVQSLQDFTKSTYSVPTNINVGFIAYTPQVQNSIGFFRSNFNFGFAGGVRPKPKDKLASVVFQMYSVCEDSMVQNTFLQGKLKIPLQKGCNYRFSNFLGLDPYSLSEYSVAVNSIGVAFTNDSVYYPTIAELRSKLKPDIESDSNNFFDKREFMEFSGIYTAKGGERYFTMGNFKTKEKTKIKPLNPHPQSASGYSAFYQIDDLSLTAIPPAHLKLNLGKDTLTCGRDQPLQLAAQQGFDSYTWNTGDTSRVLNITKAGTYIVKADFGCGVLSDTIVVKAYAYKKNQLQIGELLQKCPEEQISLKAANGYTNYTWSNGQNGAELSTSTEGIYTLQATSPEGCMVKDTVQILNITAPQKVNLGKDTVICQGKGIVLDAGTQNSVSFAWNTGTTSQTLEAKEAGNYSVAVSNKCFLVSDTISISTKDCSPIFIPNVFTPNGDGNNDTFKIRTEDNRTVMLDIYNRWGERLYHHASYQNQWNADEIPDGIYFYQITDSEYNKTEKGWVQVIR